MKDKAKQDVLVGRWFHSFIKEKDDVEWQGQIVGMPENGMYLVQLYEWGFGETSTQHIIPFKDMKKWVFYDTNEDMKYAAEHGAMSKYFFRGFDNPLKVEQNDKA